MWHFREHRPGEQRFRNCHLEGEFSGGGRATVDLSLVSAGWHTQWGKKESKKQVSMSRVCTGPQARVRCSPPVHPLPRPARAQRKQQN